MLALEKAWKESAAAFTKRSFDLGASYDRSSSSWKMSQQSFPGVSVPFSLTLPNSGMTRDGHAFGLQTLVRRTKEIDGGYWPTPRAYSFRESHQPGLTALDIRVRGLYPEKRRYWPTPRACDGDKGTRTLAGAMKESVRGRKNGVDLPTAVKFSGSAQTIGQLNPMWVEWLMGYPPGWTALEDWAMQWFRSKRGWRSKCCLD
jgi:hypothetical protein